MGDGLKRAFAATKKTRGKPSARAADPQTPTLADLLASYPKECAEAIALLASRLDRGVTMPHAAAEGLTVALDALCVVGAVTRGRECYWLTGAGDGLAIARVGAAAWLRSKLGPPDRLDAQADASLARLWDLTAEALRQGTDRSRTHALRRLVGGFVPETRGSYRKALECVVAHGWPLDVEAEVSAIWGAPPAGASR